MERSPAKSPGFEPHVLHVLLALAFALLMVGEFALDIDEWPEGRLYSLLVSGSGVVIWLGIFTGLLLRYRRNRSGRKAASPPAGSKS